MERFNNIDIKERLSTLRDAIREGAISVKFSENPNVLYSLVYTAFDDKTWSTENFNEQTVHRLYRFFDTMPVLEHGDHKHYPTPDQVATAIQNFINRRKDPWNKARSVENMTAISEDLGATV